jgi:hypothetical protein
VALEVFSKQIQFLIDTGAYYSFLPAYARKPSSQTMIIVGIDGKKSN